MSENISEQKNRAITIATKHKLSKENAKRFVNFLIEWGKLENCDWTEDGSYISEWAMRFKNKEEYSYASGEAMVALVKVDGMENAVKRYASELDDYNGYKESHVEEARKKIERCFKNQNLKGFRTVVRKNNKQVTHHRKCICKSAHRMIGKLPDVKAKRFLW